MSKSTEKSTLFDGFDPVSKAEWLQRIEADLKGRDFEETLVRTDEDGIRTKPVYHREDLRDQLVAMPSRTGNGWVKRQNFVVNHWEVARQKIKDLKGHEFGAIGLWLDFEFKPKEVLEFLEEHTDSGLRIYLGSEDHEDELTHAVQLGWERKKLKNWHGGLDLDLHIENTQSAGIFQLEQQLAHGQRDISLLHVNGDRVHWSTDSTIEEMAEILDRVAWVCEQSLEAGITLDQVKSSLRVTVNTTKDYFNSIAKLRALRMLIANVLLAHDEGLQGADQFRMVGVNTFKGRSEEDPYQNLLSHTTQGLSAVSAGVEELSLDTMDEDGDRSVAFFEHLNRNIQWLLQSESHLDLVGDPTGGSYFIETRTNELAQRAWQRFQEMSAS